MGHYVFDNSFMPSFHGVSQFAYVGRINFLCCCNYILPDTVQTVQLFTFTVNVLHSKFLCRKCA